MRCSDDPDSVDRAGSCGQQQLNLRYRSPHIVDARVERDG